MNSLSITPQQSFTGKYRVVLDLSKKGNSACFDRDLMLGQWLEQATNFKELVNTIRQRNKTEQLILDYILPDKSNNLFENCMRLVGQKFEKLM